MAQPARVSALADTLTRGTQKTCSAGGGPRLRSEAGEGDRTLDIQLGKLTKSPVSSLSGAKRSAGESARNQNDPHLATIAAAWPTLPAAMKAGIVAMVVASTEKNE